MHAILFSMLIYLGGIATILFVRPAFMFHSDGRWKEFGMNAVDKSPFPFWAFCLSWALLSFSLSRLLFATTSIAESSPLSTVANAATLATLSSGSPFKVQSNLSNNFNDLSVEPLMKSKKKSAAPAASLEEAKPGYYKLDKSAFKKTGVPRYIYIGSEMASDSEEGEED
jgi:hypothetical protein